MIPVMPACGVARRRIGGELAELSCYVGRRYVLNRWQRKSSSAMETGNGSTVANSSAAEEMGARFDSSRAPNSRVPKRATSQGVYRPYIPDSAALAQPTYEKLSVSEPHDWFSARTMKRRVFLHVGPTNSGKTHNALKALRNCQGAGLFCAPLRLLAWQVSQDLGCSLLTGQEQTEALESNITACTVEMADIVTEYDVAVVDEIQLVGDPDRGPNFTRALLGLHAKELHLCGEAGVVDLVAKICELTGDELEICTYERLSPLAMEPKAIGSLKHVRDGDCVVVFSRKGVHNVQRIIRHETGKESACVYGSLPPETRKVQANLFNSGDRSILVATDAIGMGLNLAIKRVVFYELKKFNGKELCDLLPREIRQVGGRAGRYGQGNAQGTVTTLNRRDLGTVGAAISAVEPTQIPCARVFPPREFMRARFHNAFVELLQRDARQLPIFIKERVHEGAIPSEAAADWLASKIHHAYGSVVEEVGQLRKDVGLEEKASPFALADSPEVEERLVLLRSLRLGIGNIQALAEAPFSLRSSRAKQAFLRYAMQHQAGAFALLDDCFGDPFYSEMFGPIFERYGCSPDEAHDNSRKILPKIYVGALSEQDSATRTKVAKHVQRLEESYMILDLSLWLGVRFGHPDQELEEIQELKNKCNEYITAGLALMNKIKRNKLRPYPREHYSPSTPNDNRYGKKRRADRPGHGNRRATYRQTRVREVIGEPPRKSMRGRQVPQK